MVKKSLRETTVECCSYFLGENLREHLEQQKCFVCKSSSNLNICHLERRKKGGNPSQMVRFHVRDNRSRMTDIAFKELKKCAVMCETHHREYDGVRRYGWEKQPFHDSFTKEGSTAKCATR